jgi:hypothetical protein
VDSHEKLTIEKKKLNQMNELADLCYIIALFLEILEIEKCCKKIFLAIQFFVVKKSS